ncbi:DMT family transporter [Micromonospora mirobrigensis]|uniref:Permease of the drug/metabolite transporter (DMT) superfamily n=1 Tax=Micromonospora mirobrigensis TaxID=262898 RepID=A0A1C4W7Z4_9ACTN|nr:DMT family transporter [Micromonospora mirobrigensis]SCE92304.1 Permease of the drug/metabolite transporter (DMT) superfamily [Micromonospora mirobrigensis]
MRDESSVTAPGSVTAGRAAGLALGALGVVGFSMSLPATRVAVQQLDPWFVAFGRAVGAALLAGAYLWVVGAARPTRDQWRRLCVVALGVVVGFPLFTSLALRHQSSAHGAVVITLLPAVTAVFAVLRAGERPPRPFWLASAGGLLAVLSFLAASGAVHGGPSPADLFLLAAVVLCGLGYAEGGALARDLGGARTICWALLLALPVTVPVTVLAGVAHPPTADATTWAAFGYLTVVSMFLGFVAWYAGLARGGIARVGQVQLAQPVLTLVWSALLLGERVTPASVAAAVVVLACVAVIQRSRQAGRPARGARATPLAGLVSGVRVPAVLPRRSRSSNRG